jgi:hypothetical protein
MKSGETEASRRKNIDRIERWDCMAVVCIEPIEGLRVGSTYKVKGQGNLEYNAGTDKKGWGLCLEDECAGCFDEDGKVIEGGWEKMMKKPYSERSRWVYATLDELERHFITDEENYEIYIRDEKLKSLGI